MTEPQGKAMMLWKAANVAAAPGSIAAVVALAKRLGLKRVELKIGNGINQQSSGSSASAADLPVLVQALKNEGIEVWGWHYIMLGHYWNKDTQTWINFGSPEEEAMTAALRLHDLKLDGYVMDCEGECKSPDAHERALRFATAWEKVRPAVVKHVALCSYRFPNSHNEMPWDVFCSISDIHMPQMYWQPGSVENELKISMAQLKQRKNMPYYPVGRAYAGDGHPGFVNGKDLLLTEIPQFLKLCVEAKIPTISFWGLDFLVLHQGGSDRANSIAAFQYPALATPAPAPNTPTPSTDSRSTEQKLADLEGRVGRLEAALGIKPPQ